MNFKVYENKGPNGSIKLDFVGVEHPTKQEDVIPTIQIVLKRTINKLEEKSLSGSHFIDLNETIGFLKMIQELTVPNKGFYFPPNMAPNAILTKYGQKLKENE